MPHRIAASCCSHSGSSSNCAGIWGSRDCPSVVQVGHHDAHAAIFFVSPFEEAAVLVMDGYGDVSATSAYIGCGNRLECCWRGKFFDSLGMLYTLVTHRLVGVIS